MENKRRTRSALRKEEEEKERVEALRLEEEKRKERAKFDVTVKVDKLIEADDMGNTQNQIGSVTEDFTSVRGNASEQENKIKKVMLPVTDVINKEEDLLLSES